ncbi:hypothetical protein [Myxosarcina sp. GI1(2024)]
MSSQKFGVGAAIATKIKKSPVCQSKADRFVIACGKAWVKCGKL